MARLRPYHALHGPVVTRDIAWNYERGREVSVVIFPSTYWFTQYGGPCNPYFGGFGHLNLPLAGAGYTWPGYTYPFIFQNPALFAAQAGFVG